MSKKVLQKLEEEQNRRKEKRRLARIAQEKRKAKRKREEAQKPKAVKKKQKVPKPKTWNTKEFIEQQIRAQVHVIEFARSLSIEADLPGDIKEKALNPEYAQAIHNVAYYLPTDKKLNREFIEPIVRRAFKKVEEHRKLIQRLADAGNQAENLLENTQTKLPKPRASTNTKVKYLDSLISQVLEKVNYCLQTFKDVGPELDRHSKLLASIPPTLRADLEARLKALDARDASQTADQVIENMFEREDFQLFMASVISQYLTKEMQKYKVSDLKGDVQAIKGQLDSKDNITKEQFDELHKTLKESNERDEGYEEKAKQVEEALEQIETEKADLDAYVAKTKKALNKEVKRFKKITSRKTGYKKRAGLVAAVTALGTLGLYSLLGGKTEEPVEVPVENQAEGTLITPGGKPYNLIELTKDRHYGHVLVVDGELFYRNLHDRRDPRFYPLEVVTKTEAGETVPRKRRWIMFRTKNYKGGADVNHDRQKDLIDSKGNTYVSHPRDRRVFMTGDKIRKDSL